jgi:hypothetical protein
MRKHCAEQLHPVAVPAQSSRAGQGCTPVQRSAQEDGRTTSTRIEEHAHSVLAPSPLATCVVRPLPFVFGFCLRLFCPANEAPAQVLSVLVVCAFSAVKGGANQRTEEAWRCVSNGHACRRQRSCEKSAPCRRVSATDSPGRGRASPKSDRLPQCLSGRTHDRRQTRRCATSIVCLFVLFLRVLPVAFLGLGWSASCQLS